MARCGKTLALLTHVGLKDTRGQSTSDLQMAADRTRDYFLCYSLDSLSLRDVEALSEERVVCSVISTDNSLRHVPSILSFRHGVPETIR